MKLEVKKNIREYAPFVILGYSLVFSILSYFEFYRSWFVYLPDLLGYSIFTNLFMYSVYMNKRYCTATKTCVFGLMLLNFFNLMYIALDVNGLVYDIYLLIIIIAVLVVKKYI